MTVLHTGSTKKFSGNWETIFSGNAKKAKPTAAAKATTKKPAAKTKVGAAKGPVAKKKAKSK